MIRVVLTTFSDQETAAQVVRTLVSENLAACGTILPGARSIYRWQEKIEDAAEVVVLFKIPAASEDDFIKRLAELHPYDVPEVISFEPSRVHEAYARWVLG
jgi:periplasmic divalent cation tolerance protein